MPINQGIEALVTLHFHYLASGLLQYQSSGLMVKPRSLMAISLHIMNNVISRKITLAHGRHLHHRLIGFGNRPNVVVPLFQHAMIIKS